ncbi:hypothetical protein CBL_07166 [Carabus blaptoides fortunei]
MMNMMSANTPLGTNGAKKQRIAAKFSCNKQVFSPQRSRVAKMMGQLEKNDNQGITSANGFSILWYIEKAETTRSSRKWHNTGKQNLTDSREAEHFGSEYFWCRTRGFCMIGYDLKPLVQILFGSGSNFTNTAVSMGFFKVYHLVNGQKCASGQKWDSVLNDVIIHIGILKLINYVCKMPSISHTVLLESVLKNIMDQINYADLCDQLNPTELLKYVPTVHSLSDILKQYEYDTATIYQSLNDIRMDQKHNVPLFKNVGRELFSVISPNPSNMMNNLSVVQIGEYAVKRFGGSPDMDVLLDIIYNRVLKNILAASPSPAKWSRHNY